MGIKGIYKEIGPGERISLSKLAVQHLEKTGRPLRVAIDVSIWQFQIRAAQGGTNPALRTFFYRLLRLLTLAIHPLFVFDGPKRPQWKRNKRTGGPNAGDRVGTAMAKNLINLFGFRAHDAPGEAEAECAFLQREGIVDAVLSEDVDTIMFGCGRLIRNWTSEGKGNVPTHVNHYQSESLAIDREGMVLVALMSGGDYITEGIPGCGVKVACEAAKAGFGSRLCRVKTSGSGSGSGSGADPMSAWREELKRELKTNEGKFFRTKHKALQIPDDFPNLEVLRCYTHPVVSPGSKIEKLKQVLKWNRPIDVKGLRLFVSSTFDWQYRGGALKFVKVLAPGMLVQQMLRLPNETSELDENASREVESKLIKPIKSSRAHISTDATPELRISYVPMDIVGYDPYQEEEEEVESSRGGLALNSDDDFDEVDDEDGKKGPAKTFIASDPSLIWIPESVVKYAVPIATEDWQAVREAKEQKKLAKANKAVKPRGRRKVDAGPIDSWVKVTKNIGKEKGTTARKQKLQEEQILVPLIEDLPVGASQTKEPAPEPKHPAPVQRTTRSRKAIQQKTAAGQDPWRVAGSQVAPRVTKGNQATPIKPSRRPEPVDNSPILIPSSPEMNFSPTPKKRRSPRNLEQFGVGPGGRDSPRNTGPVAGSRVNKTPKVKAKAKGSPSKWEAQDSEKKQASITSFMSKITATATIGDGVAKETKQAQASRVEFDIFLSDYEDHGEASAARFDPVRDEDGNDTSAVYHTAEESFHADSNIQTITSITDTFASPDSHAGHRTAGDVKYVNPDRPSTSPRRKNSISARSQPEGEVIRAARDKPPRPPSAGAMLTPHRGRMPSVQIISSSPAQPPSEAFFSQPPSPQMGTTAGYPHHRHLHNAWNTHDNDEKYESEDDSEDDDYDDLPTLKSLARPRNHLNSPKDHSSSARAKKNFASAFGNEGMGLGRHSSPPSPQAQAPVPGSQNRHNSRDNIAVPIPTPTSSFTSHNHDYDDNLFSFLDSRAHGSTDDPGNTGKEEVHMTKLYIRSSRREGYIEEIAVPAHRAEEERRKWEARLSRNRVGKGNANGNGRLGAGVGAGVLERKVWRRSDVCVVDLTGEE
ncbi:hypothetical protein MKZ38_007648 [Zalerion maritima]|uniref:Flap structure-specific endonuclease n=1 Tax=Zalerion maritima TaxID=339359 RepID=A0AAD5RYX3_9PEZI|nr:hypothetical protein MKZ38_007648 [Zalerion maritima]